MKSIYFLFPFKNNLFPDLDASFQSTKDRTRPNIDSRQLEGFVSSGATQSWKSQTIAICLNNFLQDCSRECLGMNKYFAKGAKWKLMGAAGRVAELGICCLNEKLHTNLSLSV